jgi:biotin synthase
MRKNNIDKYREFTRNLTETILSGRSVSPHDAEKIMALREPSDIVTIMACSNIIRQHFHGLRISLCAIINARSGKCSEDCRFCVQSRHYKTDVETYPLIKKNTILEAAKTAADAGIERFSIVTSGRGITDAKDLDILCSAVMAISAAGSPVPCASLGILSMEQLCRLRQAGLKRYHHNLESSESFFKEVCTTHSFQDRVNTIHMAQDQGFEICSGGILGLGESPSQRIELAFTLKQLKVDSVALNFLHPMNGTPFGNRSTLPAFEILKTIAMFRFVLPDREIRICGGRQECLKTLQPFIYTAGANGIMTGDYLTTKGRNTRIDIEEIRALGLDITGSHQK